MKFEKYLNIFKEHLEECNFAERTVETYIYNTKRFLEFLERYYPRILAFEKVTKEVVHDYQRYLKSYKNRKNEALSSSTQILKLITVRKFFHFLAEQDFILKSPASSLTLPREEQKLIRNIPTEDDVMDILENLNPTEPLLIRNRAIVETFYSCGIRTTELCRLKVQDVNVKEQTLAIVRGKGNKSRIVPIGQYACYYIQFK